MILGVSTYGTVYTVMSGTYNVQVYEHLSWSILSQLYKTKKHLQYYNNDHYVTPFQKNEVPVKDKHKL